MKSIRLFILIFAVSAWGSCTKEEANPTAEGMVKTVDSVSINTQIGLILLDDGSYIVVNNGQMVKLDSRGIVAWKKPIPEFTYLRTAVALPGTGFAIRSIRNGPRRTDEL